MTRREHISSRFNEIANLRSPFVVLRGIGNEPMPALGNLKSWCDLPRSQLIAHSTTLALRHNLLGMRNKSVLHYVLVARVLSLTVDLVKRIVDAEG